MNTLIVGRVYHVIDKTTGEVVKVGSTIQTLEKRFRTRDYKKKYTNHFLKEFRSIQSSEYDWYEKGNAQSPFLWHLLAAETLEVFRAGTFRKDSFSNRVCPLIQKLNGLCGDFSFMGGSIGGKISGNLAVKNKTGIHAPGFDRGTGGRVNSPAQLSAKRANFAIGRTKEHQRNAAIAAGKKNVESGWISELGKKQGRKNFESGHLAKIGKLNASKGAIARNHNQYHVLRGVVSEKCSLCKVVS